MSIPFNIAEGYRRKRRPGAYQNHVSIVMGSQGELETQMEVAFRNSLLKREEQSEMVVMCERVGAMLNRLYDSLNQIPTARDGSLTSGPTPDSRTPDHVTS